jgi:hypothetical protein
MDPSKLVEHTYRRDEFLMCEDEDRNQTHFFYCPGHASHARYLTSVDGRYLYFEDIRKILVDLRFQVKLRNALE